MSPAGNAGALKLSVILRVAVHEHSAREALADRQDLYLPYHCSSTSAIFKKTVEGVPRQLHANLMVVCMVRAWAHEAFAYAMRLMLPFGCWIVTAASGTYCGDASYPASMQATLSAVTELGGHRRLTATSMCSTATGMLFCRRHAHAVRTHELRL